MKMSAGRFPERSPRFPEKERHEDEEALAIRGMVRELREEYELGAKAIARILHVEEHRIEEILEVEGRAGGRA